MSPLAFSPTPRFTMLHASRPMLARDADSMYWMSRYVERAEHVARLLLVNSNLLIDVGDLAPKLQEQQWYSVLNIMRTNPPPAGDTSIGIRIAQYMTFDFDNPNSLISCVSRARENARGIREIISAEMWENLNTLYWSLRSEDAPARFEDSSDDFYRQVMTGSMLFQGLTDQTLAHDQRWLFTQLAKYLERIDVTCRVIETKFNILRGSDFLESALRNIHWMAVLRSCCSIEGYRRQHLGDMDPVRVASFLVLERDFPRSVRYAVNMAHWAMAGIRGEVNPLTIDPAERILGRLNAQLEYAEPAEIFAEGLAVYLQKLQQRGSEAALAVQKSYFLHRLITMLLKLTHQTELTYSDLISESVMELRMAPRQEQDQHRLSFTLAIGPPTSAFSYFDWLGNTVHAFTVNPFHNKIRIAATSVVETDRRRVEPERFADTWPIQGDFGYSVYDSLQFGGPIVDVPELAELLEVVQPQPGMSLGELALRMLHLINEKFTYQKGVTTAASPITEVLKQGSGVCQDFSHLMIGLARAARIPARYVSGLVHPDAERFRGFTQTHAWCELLFPSAGWIGFDPANNCIVGPNFVKVAQGRNFADVPPNKGLYRGSAKESIEVSIHSEELKTIPGELAAERVESLPVPTFNAGRLSARELSMQQEQQQQETRTKTQNVLRKT